MSKGREIVDYLNDIRTAILSLSSEKEMTVSRKHERSGRPLGEETFVDSIELLLARTLRPQKPGQKQKED